MKPARSTYGRVPGGSPCPDCGKRRWLTRADAKTIAKRMPAGKGIGLHPYRCGDAWHLGHLPTAVVRGDMPRADLPTRRKDIP